MSTFGSSRPFTWRHSAAATPDDLKRARRRLTIAGALFLVGGVVAIALPQIASVAAAIFVGWMLVYVSVLHAMDAFATGDRTRTILRLLLAALTFVAGLYLLLAPLDGTFTLTVVLAMWFIAIGVARIVMGVSSRGARGWWGLVLGGVLALVLGLLIALELPESAAWAVGLIVGIDMVFAGVFLIDLAQRLEPGRSG
jgi:uncharacterized membrane protein HdeD (DUF308 family)